MRPDMRARVKSGRQRRDIRVQPFETGRRRERGVKRGWLSGSQTSDIYEAAPLTARYV